MSTSQPSGGGSRAEATSSPHAVHQWQYSPRDYQVPVLDYLIQGGFAKKRAVCVWHRRAGKDLTGLNALITAALFDRVGTYFYFFPTYGQGKKIIWDGIDGNGKPFLSYIPEGAIEPNGKNETEMQVKLRNGSIIQIIGTDKIDHIVGSNPIGCVYSEYSIQNPRAWDLIRPILRENSGWAVFLYTPRGRNHGWKLFDLAEKHDGWFCQCLTVNDTKRADGTAIITADDLEDERRSGMDDDLIQQEFFCSFDASQQGSYYGSMLAYARQENRICEVEWEPNLPVFTAWDLGVNDTNSIIFFQRIGRSVKIIDYYENSSVGLPHYAKLLKERPYTYERHYLPADIAVREWSSGNRRLDTFRSLVSPHVTIAPKLRLPDGIEAVRKLFPRCTFDNRKTLPLIDALSFYHKSYDEKNRCFSDTPEHDWSSNAADAFRCLATTQRPESTSATMQTKADTGFNVYADQQRSSTAELDFAVFGT